jgi:thioesterase domain-containing protein
LENYLELNEAFAVLSEVEKKLLQHYDIEEVCVIRKEGYQYLIAFVVFKDNSELTLIEVQNFLKNQRLKNIDIPQILITLLALPVTINGEIDRKELLQLAKNCKIQSKYKFDSNSYSITKLEECLIKLFEELLDAEGLCINDDFNQFGATSAQYTLLKNKLNQIDTGVKITLQELKNTGQVKKLAKLIYKKLIPPAEMIELMHESKNNKGNIFLFYDITGDASSTYKNFVESLKDTDANFYAVNSPALFNSYDVSHLIEDVAQKIKKSISVVQPEGPYYFIGWSFGGSIAWKVTELFEAENHNIKFLGLIDSIAPGIYQSMSNEVYANELMELINKIFARSNYELSDLVSIKELANFVPLEQIELLFKKISKIDSPMKNLLDLIKASLIANYNFQPQRLTANPKVYGCSETVNKLTDMKFKNFYNVTLGWIEYSPRNIKIHKDIKANHFSLIGNDSNNKYNQALEELTSDLKLLLNNKLHHKRISPVSSPDRLADSFSSPNDQLKNSLIIDNESESFLPNNFDSDSTSFLNLVNHYIQIGMLSQKHQQKQKENKETKPTSPNITSINKKRSVGFTPDNEIKNTQAQIGYVASNMLFKNSKEINSSKFIIDHVNEKKLDSDQEDNSSEDSAVESKFNNQKKR